VLYSVSEWPEWRCEPPNRRRGLLGCPGKTFLYFLESLYVSLVSELENVWLSAQDHPPHARIRLMLASGKLPNNLKNIFNASFNNVGVGQGAEPRQIRNENENQIFPDA